ncbi:hypothetical protein RJ639_043994 [Escallonia herrerae]|uniref:Chalcone/stilbene synthase N-terminal domain-containing protein n=1 Tax=Escallonia herrerae TaxID=1293975 RepID=A0AA89B329_9ASTE|nr:hypothetical protein RJ639_043994 [Escallonia herrerae]
MGADLRLWMASSIELGGGSETVDMGQPKSKITHLVFCTTFGVDMPGADYQLIKLLNLCPFVKRLTIYQQDCFANGTVLRLAKDLLKNNIGACILFVYFKITAITFCGPSDTHLDSLVGQALFGDGATAVIVGTDPNVSVERPLFQLVSAAQTILPGSDGAIDGHFVPSGAHISSAEGCTQVDFEEHRKVAERSFCADWNQ